MRFTPTELTTDELALQTEVRAFLADELPPGSHEPGLGMSARHDKPFSKKMAERGWVGMALPKEWGGSDKKAVDRFIRPATSSTSSAPTNNVNGFCRQSVAVSSDSRSV